MELANEVPKEERNWAMLSHLSTFIGWVFPFGNLLAPLIMWQIKKDEMPFGSSQAKECLNFQLSMMLYALGGLLLFFFIIGIPILIALAIADIVFTVIAALKANDGIAYRYPMTIRFIS